MGDGSGVYENGIFRRGDVRISDLSGRKRLPIGVSEFPKAVRNFAYIDKSMLIADVLDGDADVVLYCRPRRFGKSLNLSMLQRFLEVPSPDDPAAGETASLFRGLAIWDADDGRFREHHAAYPVVHVSFSDAKGRDWGTVLGDVLLSISLEYGRHRYLLDSDRIPSEEKGFFRRVLEKEASEAEFAKSLVVLTRLLHRHHGVPAVVLIDEYDAPVMSGYTYDYYDNVVEFLKRWLTGALKDNPSLAFGVLTGVQRISKESIFSDLNNLTVNTSLSLVSDERYGFTQEEVEALAEYLGCEDGVAEARAWYDGYRFGAIDVYNPWSVLNYFSRGCTADLYWANTSGNGVLGTMVADADGATMEKLYRLLEPGCAIEEPLDASVVFPDAGVRVGALWSMLYLAGYLTTDDVLLPNSRDRVRPLRIPNREVAQLYRDEIIERFSQIAGGRDRLIALHEAVIRGDASRLTDELGNILQECASFYDLDREQSCHTLLLGLLFGVRGYGSPISNREAGFGRYDIRLVPDNPAVSPLVTIEVKRCASDGASSERLDKLAHEALDQIRDKHYEADGKDYPKKLRWGIAFGGKALAAACEKS